MDLKFEVSGRISRPVSDVFEAVVNPDKLSGYFATGGAKGRLETGATVTWNFHDFPGAFPVHVVEVEKNKRIILKWAANDPEAPAPYETTVTMRFEPTDDGRTIVTIAEARNTGGPQILLRQLHGLVADAVRHEGLCRTRHQPARRHVQVRPNPARPVARRSKLCSITSCPMPLLSPA